MSQPSSVEAPTPTHQRKPLHPVLQAALGSLDVQLEDELTRYRRQRTGRPAPPPRGLGRQPRKSLDLISINATGGRTQPQGSSALPQTAASISPRVAVPPKLTHPSQSASSRGIQPPPQRSSSSSPSGTGVVAAAPLSGMESTKVYEPIPEPDWAVTAHLAEEGGKLVSPTSSTLEPDDYLASSEELLRSLSEPEEMMKSQGKWDLLSSLFSPLGIGALLLLLVSSTTIGYILINPSSLGHLGLERLFRSPNPTTTQNSSDPDGLPESTVSQGSGLPNSPNLTSQEFVDLNLNTLSALKTSPNSGSSSISPSTTIATPQNAGVKPSPTASAKPATQTTTTQATGNQASTVVFQPDQSGQPSSGSAIAPTASTSSAPVSIPPKPQDAPVVQFPKPASITPSAAPRPKVAVAPSPSSWPPSPVPVAVRPSVAVPSVTVPSVAVPSAAVPSVTVPTVASPATPSPASTGYHYVVTNYNGDRALEEARKAVPDAYVRNFPESGARVQFGAFNDAASAQALVEQLQQQGISAQVYQP
ncbi:MAG: SPOR domain-containing protein [Leptolyngbyaceae bacterium]|nr:SPOR domain-containing protein [Leptolyngbyaceae bacterium]